MMMVVVIVILLLLMILLMMMMKRTRVMTMRHEGSDDNGLTVRWALGSVEATGGGVGWGARPPPRPVNGLALHRLVPLLVAIVIGHHLQRPSRVTPPSQPGHSARQSDRAQTDRQTDRQTDGQTDGDRLTES